MSVSTGQFGYTRREEGLNCCTHIAALFAAVAGCSVMMWRAVETADARIISACAVFSFALVCVFLSSSLYHGLGDGPMKYFAKKLDHVSIYLIICGLYTALIIVAVWNWFGLLIAALVWILGIWGTIRKFQYCPEGQKRNDLALYMAMSCLVIPIFIYLDFGTIMLLLAAAFFNLAGLIFYVKKGREYMHTVWHIFSFAASTCDFFAVMYLCGLL